MKLSEIICYTEVLKSNLCDYKDAYLLVIDNIKGHQAAQVGFKICATFIKCITKTDETTIDDAEDLDIVMPMHNLIKYSSNYS